MPLIATRGAASAQGFGEFAQATAVNYIEDVFSTWLYTGNGSTQTITNGIDLSGKGGLVWLKSRSGADPHELTNTVQGTSNSLRSNSTNGASSTDLTGFTSSGFTLGYVTGNTNLNGATEVSWTFRKQPKFFDVVTWTGNGSVPRSIPHELGSVPGFVAIKLTSGSDNWICRHKSLGDTPNDMTNYTPNSRIFLNLTNAAGGSSNIKADATNLTVNHVGDLNASGQTYVAYLFAHDAGGFGLSGSDNVISCGSYTGTGANGNNVTLGYEPQWLLTKRANAIDPWLLFDNMRGMSYSANKILYPNDSQAEDSAGGWVSPTPTGFVLNNTQSSSNGSGSTYIYIAIRRGPMKVPTLGTTVFAPATRAGTGAAVTVTGAAFPPDFLFNIDRFGTGPAARYNYDRLRGSGQTDLRTNSTAAEGSAGAIGVSSFNMNGFSIPSTGVSFLNDGAASYINYFFGRAPGYFDVVCYTGNGTAGLSVSHNLTVPPEMVIVKRRDSTGDWPVLMRNVDRLGSAGSSYRVNSTASWDPAGSYFSDSSGTFVPATDATSTVFKVSNAPAVNASAGTYVAYLFATCAGVSKVGSYTGTGTTLQVNCGFTAGSRFVLIKRADASGDWYVWDSARGIVAGNDPYLLLNNIDAETTGTDYVDTAATGFELSSTAPAALNANGGTYIFLAIA